MVCRDVVPDLKVILKELGIAEGSDEFDGFRAAFVLGQEYMRDAIIDKLGGYDAIKCAQVAASVPLRNGFIVENEP